MTIDSEWVGLPGETQQNRTYFIRKGSTFVADNPKINGDLVEPFLRALTEPTYGSPNAAQFGFTDSTLKKSADNAFQTFLLTNIDWQGFYTGQQRARFIRSFSDEHFVSEAIADYCKSADWTDDYPSITARIDFADRRPPVTIRSEKQKTLMLPWTIAEGGATTITYNAHISYALSALLQSRDANRERLSRKEFAADLPGIVGEHLSSVWASMASYDESKDVLRIEKEYHVALEHGASREADSHFAWEANLHWSDFPSNLYGEVTMPIVENQIKNTEAIPFVRRGAELAFSVPWIRRFLGAHPDASVEIIIENTTPISMGTTQITNFTSDMDTIGRRAIVSNLVDELPKSYYVMIDEQQFFSIWILLPSGNMVMWSCYQAVSGPPPTLAGFSSTLFDTKQCGQDECSGSIVLPNGSVLGPQSNEIRHS